MISSPACIAEPTRLPQQAYDHTLDVELTRMRTFLLTCTETADAAS